MPASAQLGLLDLVRAAAAEKSPKSFILKFLIKKADFFLICSTRSKERIYSTFSRHDLSGGARERGAIAVLPLPCCREKNWYFMKLLSLFNFKEQKRLTGVQKVVSQAVISRVSGLESAIIQAI